MASKVTQVDQGSGFVDDWQSGKSLAKCNLHMLKSEDSCDVSFRVGKKAAKVRAHRYVLISRSCVFHAMLCGPLEEKGNIKIPDVEPDIFEEFLKFLYTDTADPNPDNVTSLLYLAKKYAVGGLERQCLVYLRISLSPDNACVILEQAHLFDEKALFASALEVISQHGRTCLKDIVHLCHNCFHKVISSDALTANPEQIYRAALLWTEEECRRQKREITPINMRSAIGKSLYAIPFVEMDKQYYVDVVLPKQLLTNDESKTIMEIMLDPGKDPIPFRPRRKAFSLRFRDPSDLKSTDVKFHEGQVNCKADCDIVMTDRVDFECSRDIYLCGIYLFRTKSDAPSKYTVHVQQYHKNTYLEKSLYQATTRDSQIDTVHLTDPILIERGVGYYVYVRRKGKGTPWIVGNERKSVTVKQCTITQLPTGYIGGMNLINGFLVKGLI